MAAVHRVAIAAALALLMNGQAMAFDIEAHRGGRALFPENTLPSFANALREAKLAALTEPSPAAICTANIGCWMHLAETAPVPVRHWLEAVDEVTAPAPDTSGLEPASH